MADSDPFLPFGDQFCCDAPLVGFVLDGQYCNMTANFVALLGSAAAAWPLAAVQQPMPVIGEPFAGSPEQTAALTGVSIVNNWAKCEPRHTLRPRLAAQRREGMRESKRSRLCRIEKRSR